MNLYYKNFLLAAFVLLLSVDSYGRKGPRNDNRPSTNGQITSTSLRNDCVRGTAPIDQDINNVRARLGTSGDVWWDGDDGRYIVPKVTPPTPEVSSIFAGSVWMGGFDPGGNLKVAANTYGLGSTGTPSDFFPGPLDSNGETDAETCETWDRYFVVTGADVRQHIANYNTAVADGVEMNPDDIPESVKGWPGVGNRFFFDVHEFRLPEDKSNGLAGFWDVGSNGELDGEYNPELGDFPIVEIRGCEDYPVSFPDQMIFWIYNDNGNIHGESMGFPIKMEVQVQAFAFATDDEVNNMTFQRYKLINRATEDITETFFAMWVDGDLGCSTDDYVGCDVERSLAYYYNSDEVDGTTGTVCEEGVPTYGTRVPAMGIDYFRGPLDENFMELGMSSFIYYNNGSDGNHPQATIDPATAEDHYNYLSGLWRDGTPFTVGGTGYDPINTEVTKYAFPDPPNMEDGWSMCEVNAPEGDRRTLQASGPFTLQPGTKNELIVGAVWIEELRYPCPNMNPLFSFDDVAQALFDNCFELTRGPSAPDVDLVELDREIIMILTNEPGNTNNNNIRENYKELDLRAPDTTDVYKYKFEGYKVYQVVSADATDLSDPDQARLVRQFDVENGVSTIYNWEPDANPVDANNTVWTPILEVEGSDAGIQHTFSITEDQFSSTNDKILVNHKEYYFRVIAYGYNNWSTFEVVDNSPLGQRSPYISGDLNIKTTVGVPRPINNLVLNSKYGEGIQITRLEGKGNAGRYTEYTDATNERLAEFDNDTPIEFEYKPGQAPISVKIINPLEVVEGDYELSYTDSIPDNDSLYSEARFVLENLTTGVKVRGEKGIHKFYEQVMDDFGISVAVGNVLEIGEEGAANNGVVGAEIEYKDPEGVEWFNGLDGSGELGEGVPVQPFLNFIKTGKGQVDESFDPDQDFSGDLMAPNIFNPYQLLRRSDPTVYSPASDENLVFQLIRPVGWDFSKLNNVNIVFTSDKDKWSRCMVLETTTRTMSTDLSLISVGEVKNFNIRQSPSVTFEADGNGAKVDPDESRMGFGWFPGYAINAETGEQLNIFFGEASGFNCDNFTAIGRPDICDNLENPDFASDMIWNPSSEFILDRELIQTSIGAALLGGRHNIFVTNTAYDSCNVLYNSFDDKNGIVMANALKSVTWVASPLAMDLTSYEEGLIPNDMTYKLRVSKRIDAYAPSAVENNGHPRYKFSIEGATPEELNTEEEFNEQLAKISIVPNPYYGYSNYEVSALSTIIKITNLPNECTVNIFSLEGKFIKSYSRNVGPNEELAKNGIRGKQEVPNIEWDIKNAKGIPVASGTYLIHVDAPGIGERTLKSFIIQRQFDPSGL